MKPDLERMRKLNLEIVWRVMKERGLDALLATYYDNVRYVTGSRLPYVFDWWSEAYAVVIPLDKEPVSLSSSDARGEFGWKLSPFTPPPLIADQWTEIYRNIFRKLDLESSKIGVDMSLSYAMYEALKQKLPRASFVSILDELLKARAIKNSEEIIAMKEAAGIETIGLNTAYDMLKPGITENEAYAKTQVAMWRVGSEGPPRFAFLASGKRTLIDGLATNKKLKKGEAVVWDLACSYHGYQGDGCRTGVVGKISAEIRELYRALYSAHMEGIRMLRPGVKASEVDAKIRRSLREQRVPDYPFSSGHGLGLRVCELPWICSKELLRDRDMSLKSGMIIALEPTTSKAGLAAIGLEDMTLITDTGHEVLTKARYLEDAL